jgi:hypothetical protein
MAIGEGIDKLEDEFKPVIASIQRENTNVQLPVVNVGDKSLIRRKNK